MTVIWSAVAGGFLGTLALTTIVRAAMQLRAIRTQRRICALVANVSNETGGLTRLRENLNYTPEALLSNFGENPRLDRLPPRITRFEVLSAPGGSSTGERL